MSVGYRSLEITDHAKSSAISRSVTISYVDLTRCNDQTRSNLDLIGNYVFLNLIKLEFDNKRTNILYILFNSLPQLRAALSTIMSESTDESYNPV